MGRSHRPSWANGTAAAGSQRFTHVPKSMSVNALAGAVAAGAARRAGAHRPREPTSALVRGQSKRREGLLSTRSKVGVRIIVVRREPRTGAAIRAPPRANTAADSENSGRALAVTRMKQKSLPRHLVRCPAFPPASPTRRALHSQEGRNVVASSLRRASRSPWVPRNRRLRTRRKIRNRWLTGGAQKCSKREKQGCR